MSYPQPAAQGAYLLRPRTLRDLAEPSLSRTLAAVVGGAGLIALFAQISVSLPFTPVPVTGQTFAVLVVGAALGPVDGFASAALYVTAGALGAPVYAGHSHGLAVLQSATGGYLVGFMVAASLAGAFASRGWDRRFPSALGALLSGNIAVYVVGVPWLAHSLHVSIERGVELGLYPFVAGDLIKIYLASACLPAAWRLASSQ